MRKTLFVLFLMAFPVLQSFAQQRTEAEARQEAESFLTANGENIYAAKPAGVKTTSEAFQNMSLEKLGVGCGFLADGQPLYVFNTAPGFVIVSGDKRTPAILGWSDKGNDITDSVPEAFRLLLGSYAQAIMSLPLVNGVEGKALAAKQKVAPRKAQARHAAISPLMSTEWGHNSGSSFHGGPSGCVATAVAQVMYYWYEKEGFKGDQKVDIPAYSTKSNNNPISALSAPYSFSWNKMDDGGDGSSSAVELMDRFGRAVHMDYAYGGSDSYLAEIPYALRTYFGYDRGVHAAYRHDYTAEEWDDLIYNELAAGRPVVFGGCKVNSSSLSGHCFVCDGYATYKTSGGGWYGGSTTYGDYYHFNWGWSGSYDGYFLLSALNPTSSQTYNTYVDAVVGFQPPRNGSTPYSDGTPRLTCADFTFSGSQTYTRDKRTEDFVGVNIYNALFNCMDEPVSMTGRAHYPDFDMGIGLYGSDGTLLHVLAERHYGEFVIKDGFGESFCFDGLRLGAELPCGDYMIKPISRVHGTREWQADKGSDRHYITANITEKTLTLNPSAYLVYDNGRLVNKGSEETSGILFQWSSSRSSWSNASTFTSLQTAVAPGTGMSVGSYNKLTSDMGGTNIIYPTETNNYIALSDSIGRHFDDGHIVIGNDLDVKVTLSNKGVSYSGSISASLSPSVNPKPSSKSVRVDAGKSVTADFSFSGLSYDRQYTLAISAGNMRRDTTFTPRRGIVVGYGDGSRRYILDGFAMNIPDDAVWVDARYSEDVAFIVPSANANCLYVLARDASVPDNLGNCNVVVGTKAESITLTDNACGFDTPVAFTADNISYSRTFTEGNDGNSPHWSTIVLPFTVAGIVGENCRGWFKGSADKGKNVWVMDFSREENGTVFFRYANQIEANKPYIITVAADAWGDSWNLVGKTLTFTGGNATIEPRASSITTHGTHDFIGRTYGLPRHYIYEMNAEGNNFVYKQHEPSFCAFRACFLQLPSSAYQAKTMSIAIDNGTATGVGVLQTPLSSNAKADWLYDLQGRKYGMEPAQQGIYIKGNKIITIGR